MSLLQSTGTQGQNRDQIGLSVIIYIYKSSINTVLSVNATIGFFLKTFLVVKVTLPCTRNGIKN